MRKAWPIITLYAMGFFASLYYWGLSLDFNPAYFNAHSLTNLAALLGFTAMTFQLVSSARWRLFEEKAGLDVLLSLHRTMGIFAFVMLLFHGLFHMFQNISLKLIPGVFEGMGVTALFLLTAVAVTAIWYRRLRIPYEVWHTIHGLTVVVYFFGFIHSINLGGTLNSSPEFMTIWKVFAAFAGISLAKILIRKTMLFINRHTIESVEVDPSGITHLHIAADIGFVPGQFMFVGRKGRGLIIPHPFTITSAPGSERISFSVKGVGDFTKGAAAFTPGETVHIDGPYGAFTLPSKGIGTGDSLLCIAGGIGITPFLAWLRGTPPEEFPRDTVLLWGNRTPSDAVFAEELHGLAKDRGVKVIHAFSRTSEDSLADQFGFDAVAGRIDADLIESSAPSLQDRQIFLCGPKDMMDNVTKLLRGKGVPSFRIHRERFGF